MVATTKRPALVARQTKAVLGPVEFKADGAPGSFRATFSLFNTKDLDGDVTLPGAFDVGAPVRLAAFGHDWYSPPIGVGVIGADDQRAWIDGQFNLNMQSGRDTYESVKALGALQQWSYGYDVVEASADQFEGERVQLLKKLTVHEVSPVMLGAQPLTSTDQIKGAKAGARNSAADMDLMRQVMTHLDDMRTLMGQIMGDMQDPPANTNADGENADGKASKGESPKAETGSTEILAARVAVELLELGD